MPTSGFEAKALRVRTSLAFRIGLAGVAAAFMPFTPALAQGFTLADLVEGIAALDPLHRRRRESLDEIVLRGALHIHDVAIARDRDPGRRKVDPFVDVDAPPRPVVEIVVDQNRLTACRLAANAADQVPVGIAHGDDLGPVGPLTDPEGILDQNGERVFRGGGWNSVSGTCRSAAQLDGNWAGRGPGLGFRLVRTLQPGE